MTISKEAACCGILEDELFGEWRVKESRFRALSCGFMFLSSESREEPDDDGECTGTVGLVALLVDNFRVFFLMKSVERLSELAWVRKKVATRWGIVVREREGSLPLSTVRKVLWKLRSSKSHRLDCRGDNV
jgi:hypothetical protein